MAAWSGWLAAVAIVLAASVPLGQRVRAGKRAPPGSPPIRLHVMIGLVVSMLAFGHTLLVIPALGSPAATGGGVVALVPGVAAFFLLVAHAGLGLQLRNEKLKDRAAKRRAHTITAISIAIAVAIHATLLARAG
jgi:cytochrome b561